MKGHSHAHFRQLIINKLLSITATLHSRNRQGPTFSRCLRSTGTTCLAAARIAITIMGIMVGLPFWRMLSFGCSKIYSSIRGPYICLVHTTWTIRTMSPALQSTLTILQQNNYLTRMFLLTSERFISQHQYSLYPHCCWIWLWWVMGSVPRVRANFYIVGAYIFERGIILAIIHEVFIFSLTTRVDRIHLG